MVINRNYWIVDAEWVVVLTIKIVWEPPTTHSTAPSPYLAHPSHITHMTTESLAGASCDVFHLCLKVTNSLNRLIHKIKNPDPSITALSIEIALLSQVQNSIHESFSQSSLAKAALSAETGNEQYWQHVRRSVDDCKGTIEILEQKLEKAIKGRKKGLFSHSQYKLEMTTAEITTLKDQIAAYRETMQLSLYLITV